MGSRSLKLERSRAIQMGLLRENMEVTEYGMTYKAYPQMEGSHYPPSLAHVRQSQVNGNRLL